MESKKQSVNTFIKGMDKDIDISLISKESYIDAHNFRLVTSTGNTSMSLEVVDGNSLIQSVPSGYTIIGYCNVRNKLVLFTTNNGNGLYSNTRIYTSTVSDSSLSSLTLIYDDSTTIDSSRLNLNSSNPVQAIGRYESNLIQKVYFCDGLNNLRYFNLLTIQSNQSINQFDIIPNFTLSVPQIQSLTYGDLPAGKIQYAYQLYNQNGSETLFSPCSNLVSLTNTNSTSTTNKLYLGNDTGTNSGRGVIFTIPNYLGFSKIRVISILYTQLNGVPSINIIAEENLPSTSISGPLIFTDFGTISLGTYTYEELAVIGRYLFVPQTIETKNNYLFAGNILQEQWDVTYDARAYRFVSSTSTGSLTIGHSGLWKGDGSWDIINSSYQAYGSSISLTHDAINPYNNVGLDGTRSDSSPSNTQLYNFAYQTDGVTVGGQGPNVSYNFIDNLFILDNSTKGNEMSVTYPYTDFSNPVLETSMKGYQRDEIYRFGIIFYDTKGRQSTVKWIGDIRFPTNISGSPIDIADSMLSSTGSYVNGIVGENVGIRFTISNLSSLISQGASSYQIVRCQRTSTDRTILAQGFVMPMVIRSNSVSADTLGAQLLYMHSLIPDNQADTKLSEPGAGIQYNIVEFISPEVNINQNITYSSGDRLDITGQLTSVSSYCNTTSAYLNSTSGTGLGTANNSYVYKYHKSSNSLVTPQYIGINNTYLTDPLTSGLSTTGLNINLTYLYQSIGEWGSNVFSNIGTKLVIELNSNASISYLTSPSISFGSGVPAQSIRGQMRANYRRPNGSSLSTVTSQYGGNTYYDRQNCTYIECSNITNCQTSSSSINVYSGDTYICMYDYLRNIVPNPVSTFANVNQDRCQIALYFPVETGINLRYRSDTSISKININSTGANNYSASLFMQEQSGSYGTGAPNEYNQTTDLYLYNSVYSQEDTTIKFFPKNDNIIYGNQLFDSRIVVSNKKISGEETDSWLQFETNNFLDVDTKYGSINSLIEYNDHLLFFQDNAFGDVSVSPRSLLSDNNPGSLVLGTGAVLDRYDYISTTVGNKYKFGNIVGQNGIYWYDTNSKTIYNYSGSVKPLSKLKGLFSYLNTFGDASTTCITGYDYKYNEVLFTLSNSSSQINTISYSEVVDSFISFSDMLPSQYISVYNKQLYTVPFISLITYGGNSLWLHNSGNKSNYYGVLFPSTLSFVINDNFQHTKVFDSIIYNSKSKSSYIFDINVIDNFADTFNTIQCLNTKQNTGVIPIVVNDPTSTTLTLTNNTFKRENGFITILPRNIVTSAAYTNIDIKSGSNLNSSRLFQERLRDKYLIVNLVYNNSNSYVFSIPYITSNYRVSIR